MISARYSSALLSWSLASIVDARCGPSKLPFAWLVLALEIAVRRSSRPSPSAAICRGFTCTRTAGRWPPDSVTSPTPDSCEIFCATRVSARSCTFGKARLFDVIASVTIGASAGLTLL